jgi:integrase
MSSKSVKDLAPGEMLWLGSGLFCRMNKRDGLKYGIQFVDPDGVARREMIGTKTQAKEALKARCGQVVEGRYKKPRRNVKTLRELYAEYKTYQESEFVSDRSLRALDAMLDRLPQNMRADKLTRARIQKYKNDRGAEVSRKTGRPVSKTTINRELNALKGMLSYAVENDLLDENVAAGMKNIKVQQTENAGNEISREEEEALVKAAVPHLRPLVRVGIHTGMRVDHELIRLQWTAGEPGADHPYVDDDAGEIVVRRSKGKRTRRIPMNPHVLAALKSIEGSREGHVFHRDGQSLASFPRSAWKTAIRRAVAALEPDSKALREKHPLNGCTPHSMRHTYCTRLGYLIGPDFGVRDMLELTGHAGIAALEVYLHTNAERRKWAVDRVSTWVVHGDFDESNSLK